MRTNYIDILSEKIEIPIIQRDYAQGRTDSKTNKIRRDFLDVLFGFIMQLSQKPNAEIELDFIYGFNEKNADGKQSEFIPIDGQQRLTALWLLYWFVGAKENISNSGKVFLSNFVYETRHSTSQFCRELIQFTPAFTNATISSEIKDQPWYFETWDYDPSIQAMLVVLDDIENRYTDLGLPDIWTKIVSNSCPFYFYKLDMKKVGLTDDLYIKMNSRGKPLTEFEYFKAGFSELINNTNNKSRFEQSVDGIWIDTIWEIIVESGKVDKEDDIALTVDNAFLNLFNFITSVIAFRKDIKTSEGERYTDTVETAELLPAIYSDISNQLFLFDTLDAICLQHKQSPGFWSDTFYYGKIGFDTKKARLFFQHNELDLLKRCLFNYHNTGLSFPEQLILIACFTQFNHPQQKFSDRIRTVRNLAINSENELRETIIGKSFDEVENYVLNGNLDVFDNFKTDQIEEEKRKDHFLQKAFNDKQILQQLEDSDYFRGNISLLPLDVDFGDRAKTFLKMFDEDDFVKQFSLTSNLLLCFGDYSQDKGKLSNLMIPNSRDLRRYLTTGINKHQLAEKTAPVIIECLDFFRTNTTTTIEQKITDTLSVYDNGSRDWRYYFIKYPSFRQYCHYGYFQWRDDNYLIWKMGKEQFNGYHWDPFLHEIFLSMQSPKLVLENYGYRLYISTKTDRLWLSTVPNGFQLEDANGTTINASMSNLIGNGTLNSDGILEISQDVEGIDIEDRLEKIKPIIKALI